VAELYHVGLTVKNLDRSVAFYRDIAGMTETWRYDVTGKEHGMLTNNPNATLKGVHLTAGPITLQLLEYQQGGGATLDLHHNNIGSPHFCFYIADVDAKYEELKSRGDVIITSGIVEIAPKVRSFYTEDPDGVPVEFLEMEHSPSA